MNIGVSTASTLPTGSPALPSSQGATAGDAFALLMSVGSPQGEAPVQADAQQAGEAAAPVATVPMQDPVSAVKAADALVASLAPAKASEAEGASQPSVPPAPVAPTIARQTEVRQRETHAPEKKDGRGKAKNASPELPVPSETPDKAIEAILIALPAATEIPATSAPVQASAAEAVAIAAAIPAATPSPAKIDQRALSANEAEDFAPAAVTKDAAPIAVAKDAPAAVETPKEAVAVTIVQAAPVKDLEVSVVVEPGISGLDVSDETAPVVATPVAAGPAKARPAPMPAVASEKAVDTPKTGSARAQAVAEKPVVTPETPVMPASVHAARPVEAGMTLVQQAAPAAPLTSAPVDQVAERQLDLVRNEQWLGELARDIASSADDNHKLNFKLMPPQLGRLDVDLSRSHHGLSLTIRTETESAQAILTAAQPRLVEEMRAQGLKLADTQMFSGDMRQSSNQGGQAQPAPALIEAFIPQAETEEAAHETVRDGRYA